jgi:uncharacterized protein (TIGR03067 family)
MRSTTHGWIAATAVAISLFGYVVCEAQVARQDAATAIRGTWSGTQSGDKPFDEVTHYGTVTVIITESTVVRRWALPAGAVPGTAVMRGTNVSLSEEKDANGKTWEIEKYSYVLRPAASPMQIDLAAVDADGRKWVFKGILDLEADRLTICYDTPESPRPKDFPRTPGGSTLWTLQRVKR